jgi:hypothetical protein
MVKRSMVGKNRQPHFKPVAVVVVGLAAMLISVLPNGAQASSNLCVNQAAAKAVLPRSKLPSIRPRLRTRPS